MKKRLFIVHRWDGSPEKDWLPWAKEVLEKKGFDVVVPYMPDTEKPEINAWISCLTEHIGAPDGETFFIGHSIGCQTVMRYLERIYPQKVGSVIFVAGWFNLANLEDDESEQIAAPWLKETIDFGKVRAVVRNIDVILSDNDPFVPLSDRNIFEEKLHANVIVEQGRGHFTKGDGITELQTLLRLL